MATNILQRNNVRVLGQGEKTIMFAHGFGCDQNMWRFMTPAFESAYRIVLFDYVGCGKSDSQAYDAERYASLYGYAEDILDICNVLALKNIIFVGHSVSAMIGMLAALQQPSVIGTLVMIGPSPRYLNDKDYIGGFERKDLEGLFDVMDNNYIGWAGFLAPVVMKNDDRPELARELEESFCSTDPIMARRFAEVTFFSDNREDLSNVDLPTLVMQCSDDAIAPDSVGAYTAENIAGSTFVKMKATGHCPHMSHPEESIELIREFLRSVG